MDIFRIASDEVLTAELLAEFIQKNKTITHERYDKQWRAYKNKYDIFDFNLNPKKPEYKPDNRIAVNFTKYIVDTMNGFFIGIPIKAECDDTKVKEYVEMLDAYNMQDDGNFELSKYMSLFGRAYEMYYVDEQGKIGITYLKPTEAFMIYDDSVLCRPRYFVRYYIDAEKEEYGSVSDETTVRYFKITGGVKFYPDEKIHGFDGIPAVEFVENAERIGICEGAMSQINAFNKALSEKANDVDYFSDAYLKILGQRLEDKDLQNIRSNRIINFDGGTEGLDIDFLQRPSADTSQENLLNRLWTTIFQTTSVVNMQDDDFATSSGIALRYKMKPMTDMAMAKQRKFTAGLNKRYRLIFSNPVSGMHADAWMKLRFYFTFNFPANLSEEADIASKLIGITSRKTALKPLSIVDDVDTELKLIEEDYDPTGYNTDYGTNRTIE